MIIHYPRIRLYTGRGTRRLYIRESLNVTFYMRCSHQEVVHDVMRALASYRRSVRPTALGWYANPYSGEWDELDEKGEMFIQRNLLGEPATQVWLREFPNATTGYEFLYKAHVVDPRDVGMTSAVSFLLPTEELEAHGPEWLRGLALELAAGLPFASGHTGLCFNHPESVVGTTEHIREPAFCHPGIDIPGLHFDSLSIGTRIKGVQWLNFLGPPVLACLGGHEGLRTRLHASGTTVEALGGERAVVTLGPWPEAGELTQGQTLPAYRELARVLEPWLYLNRSPWGGFSDEDMRRWERRFLDP